MTHWKVLVSNSETLSAADLGTHSITATIAGVEGGAFEREDGKPPDKTALVSFVGKEKKLAAKFINCTLIEAMFGPDYEGWAGHELTLFVDKVEVKGAMYGKPCVRVKGSPEIAGTITVEMKMPRKKAPVIRRLVPITKPSATVDPVTGEVGDDDIGFGDDAPYPSENDTEALSSDSGAESDAGAADGTIPGRGAKSAQGELA